MCGWHTDVSYSRCLRSYAWPQSRRGVADDVIHQELRPIGENSAAEGQVLPNFLDISKDPPPPSAGEFTRASREERERAERLESRGSGHVQQALHSLTIQIASLLLMELCQTLKDQKWRRARRHDEELQGRELWRMMCPRRRRRNAWSALI